MLWLECACHQPMESLQAVLRKKTVFIFSTHWGYHNPEIRKWALPLSTPTMRNLWLRVDVGPFRLSRLTGLMLQERQRAHTFLLSFKFQVCASTGTNCIMSKILTASNFWKMDFTFPNMFYIFIYKERIRMNAECSKKINNIGQGLSEIVNTFKFGMPFSTFSL